MPAHRLWMKSGASGRAVNLNHSPIEDDCNENGHNLETQADHQRFYGQAKQLTDTHCFKAASHGIEGGLYVDIGIAADYSGSSRNDILTDVEYRHHDVKGIGYEVDRDCGLEEPLEEHPCVHLVHIVLFRYHGNKLVTQHKGNDDTGDGDYHAFG